MKYKNSIDVNKVLDTVQHVHDNFSFYHDGKKHNVNGFIVIRIGKYLKLMIPGSTKALAFVTKSTNRILSLLSGSDDYLAPCVLLNRQNSNRSYNIHYCFKNGILTQYSYLDSNAEWVYEQKEVQLTKEFVFESILSNNFWLSYEEALRVMHMSNNMILELYLYEE